MQQTRAQSARTFYFPFAISISMRELMLGFNLFPSARPCDVRRSIVGMRSCNGAMEMVRTALRFHLPTGPVRAATSLSQMCDV